MLVKVGLCNMSLLHVKNACTIGLPECSMWLFAMAMIAPLSPRFPTEPCCPTMASILYVEQVSTSKTEAFNNLAQLECYDLPPYYTTYDFLTTLPNQSYMLQYVITYVDYRAILAND